MAVHESPAACNSPRRRLSWPYVCMRSCQPIVRSSMSYHEQGGYPGLYQLNRSLYCAWLPSS